MEYTTQLSTNKISCGPNTSFVNSFGMIQWCRSWKTTKKNKLYQGIKKTEIWGQTNAGNCRIWFMRQWSNPTLEQTNKKQNKWILPYFQRILQNQGTAALCNENLETACFKSNKRFFYEILKMIWPHCSPCTPKSSIRGVPVWLDADTKG